MNKITMFEKPFKSVNVITSAGDVLVSESSEIKIKTVNELTGETNVLEGTVQKLASKKMELIADGIPHPVVVMFSEIDEIEVL